jgi:hypothetical protein
VLVKTIALTVDSFLPKGVCAAQCVYLNWEANGDLRIRKLGARESVRTLEWARARGVEERF